MRTITLHAIAVSLLLLPSGAIAQTKNRTATLEEVVVTARKRNESQQDVPLAVTAVSAEEMAANNISTIADIAKIAPGLDQREGRKQGGFSIRGIGQERLNDIGADPGVGVYLDGMFLARNDSQLLDTVTVQSVQVLRGPQGTLFGKNSIGGAIIVTTKDPYEEFTVNVSSKLDSLGQRDAQIAVDVPLIEDKLYSKWTIGSIRSDGYAEDDDTGRDLGDDDRIVAAVQLMWNINDAMQLKTLAYFNKQQENIPPHYCQQVTTEGALSFARAPGREGAYHEICTEAEQLIGTEKVSHENQTAEFSSRDALFGATFTWDTDIGTFKSISSYSLKGENFSDFDFDATDLLNIRSSSYIREQLKRQNVYDDEGSRYTLGQEFQFSGTAFDDRMTYTVGLFASWESLDKQLVGQSSTKEGWIGFEELPGFPSPNDVCGVSMVQDCLFVRGVHIANLTSLDNTSYAAFSQLTYDITPTLHLTAGLRYSYEERAIKSEAFGAEQVPSGVGTPVPGPAGGLPVTVMTEAQFNMLEGQEIGLSRPGDVLSGVTDFERLSPMLSLSWDAGDVFEWDSVDGLLLYATISEGFKSGGFNVLPDGLSTFEPEFVISTELGFKLDAMDRRLRFNLALYNSDYEDVQVVLANLPPLGAPELSTNNAGLGQIQGIEFEMTWLLTANWMLSASGNYIDADILEYTDQLSANLFTGERELVDRSDEPFPFIPEYVYNLSARYSLPTDFGEFMFVLSRNTRAGIFMGADALTGQQRFRDAATTDSFSVWSGRISWLPFDDQRMRVALYGNNLADEEYVATGSAVYSGFGTNSITLGKVRHIGLEVNYEFR